MQMLRRPEPDDRKIAGNFTAQVEKRRRGGYILKQSAIRQSTSSQEYERETEKYENQRGPWTPMA